MEFSGSTRQQIARKLSSVNPGLSHNTILSLLMDREGNLWSAQMVAGSTTSDGRSSMWPRADEMQSLCQDTNGVFWAMSGNELVSLNHGKRSAIPLNRLRPLPAATARMA
jgi:ligand-binding sensor domain-containing protein